MGQMMKKIELFTDGACSGNPGVGGWGAILKYNKIEKEYSGGEKETTNNRMELTAVIEGLNALKESCDVTIYSDSKYVVDAIEKKWLENWQKNNWKKSDKKPVLNQELWEALITAMQRHKIKFVWVKGHAGHPENERCDGLAVDFCNQLKKI